MGYVAKTSIWLNRIVIVFISILFTVIGVKNIVHPAENAILSGITLGSARALSVARVSMGAFPFAFAIITFTSIFSNKQLFRGIFTVFVLISLVTIVRLIGFAIDGAAPFIAPEIVVTILSGTGLFLELKRREQAAKL